MTTPPPIDDDHFDYDGGQRQCISGFGKNTKGAALDLVNDGFNGEKYRALLWHIDELVRWCRGLNREAQEIREHNERLIEELLTNGSGWDRESLLEFIRNPPSKAEHRERNTIACPCCGELTVVDVKCIEECDECGVPFLYDAVPLNPRVT